MKHIILSVFFLLMFISINGFAQPAPFKGTLLFNLTEKEHTGNYIRSEDFKSKKVQLLSFSKESELTYDTVNKAFSFTVRGYEKKSFAIVYGKDTIFINYPSLPFSTVRIVMQIPLNGNSFSFYNTHIYDAIHSNKGNNRTGIFNLCQGCFISKTYQMNEETKKQFQDKVSQLSKIELKE